MDLANKVRDRRIELKMSQDELAKKMGYKSRTSINKIENGRPVTQKIIVKLAEALDVSVAYLMGWEEEIKKDPAEAAAKAADILLNNEVLNIVDMYLKLNEDKRKQVTDYITFLSDRD